MIRDERALEKKWRGDKKLQCKRLISNIRRKFCLYLCARRQYGYLQTLFSFANIFTKDKNNALYVDDE